MEPALGRYADNPDGFYFLHADFTVTAGIRRDRNIAFVCVDDAWKRFCQKEFESPLPHGDAIAAAVVADHAKVFCATEGRKVITSFVLEMLDAQGVRVPPDELNQPLILLGLDSLSSVDLVLAVDASFDVPIFAVAALASLSVSDIALHVTAAIEDRIESVARIE